jgi:hypothetical protein
MCIPQLNWREKLSVTPVLMCNSIIIYHEICRSFICLWFLENKPHNNLSKKLKVNTLNWNENFRFVGRCHVFIRGCMALWEKWNIQFLLLVQNALLSKYTTWDTLLETMQCNEYWKFINLQPDYLKDRVSGYRMWY